MDYINAQFWSSMTIIVLKMTHSFVGRTSINNVTEIVDDKQKLPSTLLHASSDRSKGGGDIKDKKAKV